MDAAKIEELLRETILKLLTGKDRSRDYDPVLEGWDSAVHACLAEVPALAQAVVGAWEEDLQDEQTRGDEWREQAEIMRLERDALKADVARLNAEVARLTEPKSEYGQYLVARRGEIKTAAEHTVAEASAEVERLRGALEEIAQGKGEFSRDPLTHASNVIDEAKATAKAALSPPPLAPREGREG